MFERVLNTLLQSTSEAYLEPSQTFSQKKDSIVDVQVCSKCVFNLFWEKFILENPKARLFCRIDKV